MFLFLFLECVANTYFFATSSDLGYLGGFLQALIVSIANVGLSYLFGLLALPQKNHVWRTRKLIGGLSALIYFAAILALHLLIAHYRDLLAIDPDNAIRLTLPRFRQAPFTFDTLESILVFVIGAIISIIAVAKGYAHDDRYPGYGQVNRLHKNREAAYDLKEMEIRNTLVDLLTEAEETVSSRLKRQEERIKEMEDLFSGAKSVVGHIDNLDHQVAEVLNTAVMIYRTANSSVRTEAAPGYFTQTLNLKNRLNKGCDILMIESLELMVCDAKKKLDATRSNAGNALEELYEASDNISRKIDNMADVIDGKAKNRISQK